MSSHLPERRRRELMDLPNELLYEIVKHLTAQQPKYPDLGVIKYSPLCSVSLTNKRLHDISRRFIWRQLYYHSMSMKEPLGFGVHHLTRRSYTPLADLWTKDVNRMWEVRLHDKEIKSLSVGRLRYPLRTDMQFYLIPWITSAPPVISLRHLETFECVGAVSHISAVHALAHTNPALKSVALVWIEPFVFPALNYLPDLDSIRLYLVDWVIPDISATAPLLNPRMTFHSLTTLVVNNGGTRTDLFSLYITQLSFPRLRVLNIQEPEIAAPLAFDFVQRHSTLLEVTMYSPTANFRLEAIIKLIHGTGTWISVPDTRLDQPSFVELSQASPYPTSFSHFFGVVTEFSFSRSPLISRAFEWTSSKGSPYQRYTCTGLALRLVDDEAIPEEFDETWSDMLPFLKVVPKSLGYIQEFHLASSEPMSNRISFDIMMGTIGEDLRGWPNVRKMTISWPITCAYWTCPHKSVGSRPSHCERCPRAGIQFLDEPCPPAFYSDGRPTTLNLLPSIYYSDTARVAPAVRIALRLPDDAELDGDDPHLLLSAWEAHNYPLVARHVRKLAELNPALEQFDWVVRECDNQNDTVRWDWKIARHADRSVKTVVGDLRWTGCARGTPPPFLALVGEERAYAYRDAGGRWIPDYEWPPVPPVEVNA